MHKEGNVSTQRIVQLLISFAILTGVALVSEKSRSLAGILAVLPLNVTLALWLVASNNPGDSKLAADFSRMMMLGLLPGILFLGVCWAAFRRGWTLPQAIGAGYLTWTLAMGAYKGIEWWVINKAHL